MIRVSRAWDSFWADYAAALLIWAVLGLALVVLLAIVFQLGRRRGWEDKARHEVRMAWLAAIEEDQLRSARTQPIVQLPVQREPVDR